MRVTILGCGGSNGVPTIGNRWGTCDPAEPRNRRLRPSILVEHADTVILVDTTPDLREQLLAARVARLDAVLFSHDHADHSHGVDDLREVNRLMSAPIPIYGLPETVNNLSNRFSYCFQPLEPGAQSYYRPVLTPHTISGTAPFTVGALTIRPFLQDHGYWRTAGYRFGDFAYSTDVLRLNEAAFVALAGVNAWVVDCVREEPHPVHSHLSQTLGWIARVKPRRAWLTHMNNTMDYRTLMASLPTGVEPAYDGLVIDADADVDEAGPGPGPLIRHV
jgi:phosphoribosyl 1,2-cyclic phosphate phosphodiesterase